MDVGGTHTDLVLVDGAGGVRVEKVASTPANPSVAVLEGIGRLFAAGIAPNDIGFFGHGTTVTTNALLQMKGARTGNRNAARPERACLSPTARHGRPGACPLSSCPNKSIAVRFGLGGGLCRNGRDRRRPPVVTPDSFRPSMPPVTGEGASFDTPAFGGLLRMRDGGAPAAGYSGCREGSGRPPPTLILSSGPSAALGAGCAAYRRGLIYLA